jgi:hypothetical protein
MAENSKPAILANTTAGAVPMIYRSAIFPREAFDKMVKLGRANALPRSDLT